MKGLVIIGAGGFGREVLQYAIDMLRANLDVGWDIVGFLDDNISALDEYECEYKVVGKISGHEVNCDNVYICAIGDPLVKARICHEFLNKGANFINIIHPSAYIGRTCKIGIGNVLCPNSVLTTDVTIGNFVFINCHANCGHDSIVNDGCTISPFCDITGYARLDECVFLGSHASICPSVFIGRCAKIGAGAAVIDDIPSNCTAVGVPAKVVKHYNSEAKI